MTVAVTLRWIALAVGCVYAPFQWRIDSQRYPLLLLVLWFAFWAAVSAVVTWQLGRGRHWARVTAALFASLGALVCIYYLRSGTIDRVQSVYIVSATTLEGVAVFLVFGPGRRFFGKSDS